MSEVVAFSAISNLWNPDLAPTTPAQRTWRWYHFAALWIGMVMCIPAYTLAAGLVAAGMSWRETVATIFLGNLIVLVPMLLNGHAGAKYGIPFAVLARCSFGVHGARLPAMMRALVACGWYGIQSWFGGMLIFNLSKAVLGHAAVAHPIPWIGLAPQELVCFLIFWALQLFFVVHGMDAIRKLETYTAPIKIAICFALLYWAWKQAGGAHAPMQQGYPAGKGARAAEDIFWPSLTAMVGFWATLALNIPDFTRFAKSSRDQVIGQAVGLPGPMALLAALAIFVTTATVTAYGQALWDPTDIASRMTGAAAFLAISVLVIDTMCVNLAANLVGPAFDFAALNPRKISYRTGGLITVTLAVAMMPWKIIASLQGYIFTWLVGYSALLGPVAGIMIADYYLIRRGRVSVASLYSPAGIYRYSGGWNLVALAALLLGIVPNLPGFLSAAFPDTFSGVSLMLRSVYTYAWFVGFFVASACYSLGMFMFYPRAATAEGAAHHEQPTGSGEGEKPI